MGRILLPLVAGLLGACSDASLKTVNSAPTATITSHITGEEVMADSPFTLTGVASDSDDRTEELEATWLIGSDAVCAAAAPESGGFSDCVLSLPEGETVVTLLVQDPSGMSGSAQVMLVALSAPGDDTGEPPGDDTGEPPGDDTGEPPENIAPTCAITAPLDGAVMGAGVSVDFLGVVADTEDAPEALTIAWLSDVDGTLSTEGAAAMGIVSLSTDALTVGAHTITLSATDTAGAACTALVAISINGQPTAPEVVIEPGPALTSDDLTAVVVTPSTDPEGDAISYTFAWSVDGTPVATSASSVSAADTTKGETWSVTVTPSDGLSAGSTGEASREISNTPPVLDSVTLAPSSAVTGDDLSCTPGSTADADGDSVSLATSWTIDGVLSSTTDTTLPASATESGSVIFCTVTPSDEEEAGDPVSSMSITIGNTDPVVDSVTITPATGVTVHSTLTCTATASDADGDTPAITLAWDIDGVAAGAGSTLDLSSAGAVKGQVVQCTATATDSTGGTDSAAYSVTVDNTPPRLDDAVISPSVAYTNDTLSISTSAIEPDADPLTYAMTWFVNGAEVHTGSTLSGATYFDKDDEVYAVVVADDGEEESAPFTTGAITIQNTPPTAPEVSLSEVGWSGSVECESGWTMMPDDLRCVMPFADRESWPNAENACNELGGNLVRISSAEENGFLYHLFGDLGGSSRFWTGGNDREDEGTFVWSDGEPLTYTDWRSGEPNDYGSGEDCLVINDGGTWNDGTCESEFGYICQVYESRVGVDLSCIIDVESTDDDGDDIDYTVVWDVDGIPFTDTETTTHTGDTISLDDIYAGDVWTCTVTPNDGEEDGPAESATTTIETCFAGWEPEVDLADADYSFIGEGSDDRAGMAVSSAGDVDGDGLDDFLVGAYQSDPGGHDSGKAYLFLGSSLGSSGTIDLADADYSFLGEGSADYAGYSVSDAGDVDGDGLADFMVGAPGNDDTRPYAGKAYLFLGASLGSSATIDLSAADYIFEGEESEDKAGVSVAGVGDVDGDGLDDVLVGALGNDEGGSRAGKVYLIFGASLGISSTIDLADADYSFVGEASEDIVGASLMRAGDVDGDGLDDLLIGAYGSDEGHGKAYLIFGVSLGSDTTILLADADYSFLGEYSSDYAGYAVSGAGDVDGDGLADIVVGAKLNDEGGGGAGKAYLFPGSSLGSDTTIDLADAPYTFIGEAGDQAAFRVLSPGDVDGDGLSDLMFTAPGSESFTGKAYLVLGSSVGVMDRHLANADYIFVGESPDDYVGFGWTRPAGDVNGDGLDDILLGAPYSDDGGSDDGKAYLLLAPTDITLDCEG